MRKMFTLEDPSIVHVGTWIERKSVDADKEGPWIERKSVDADKSTTEGMNLGKLLNISEPLCKKGYLLQNSPFIRLLQLVNISP